MEIEEKNEEGEKIMMKIKQKMAAGVLSVMLLSGAAAGALHSFAAEDGNRAAKAPFSESMKERPAMTEEQKAEFEKERRQHQQQMEAMHSKWQALGDAQKEEIYKLEEQRLDLELQMAEKYLAAGLIDQKRADEMKEHIKQRKADLRKDSRLPMMTIGGKRGRGGKGFGDSQAAPPMGNPQSDAQ